MVGMLVDRRRPSTALVPAALVAAVLATMLWSCGGQTPPERLSHQDELRLQHQLGPRVSLAMPVLAQRARQDSAGADALCDLAGALVRTGAYAEAAEVYERAVTRYPASARAHYGLGHVLARTGQFEGAIRHWQRTVELVPDFANAHFDLGVAHAQRAPTAVDQPANLSYTDLDAAIEHCARAVELEPGNAHFQQNLGRALQLRHRSEEAAAAYERALSLDRRLIDAHRFLGEIRLEQGRAVEARAALAAVVDLDSTDAVGCYQLGKALERVGDADGAADQYERAVALEPQYRDAWYSLAKLAHRLGRTEAGDRALARFESMEEETELQAARRRVQRTPNGVVERRALAVVLARSGQSQQAVDELRVALALAAEGERAAIHHDLGLIFDRLGDPMAAMAALQRAAAAAPDTARFQLHLGQLYAKVGRDSLAAVTLERALLAAPGWTQARYELAMVHLKARRVERAQALFTDVLEGEPSHLDARFGLGLTYLDQRHYARAAAQLEAVLAQDPDYPRARQVLARVRRQLEASHD